MNIFALDQDPAKAAAFHCDVHVVKMILESAQMLSTVLRGIGADCPSLYKPTHAKHPCTIWAGETRSNFLWLVSLATELGKEHARRHSPKRPHKSLSVIHTARTMAAGLPAGPLTPFAQAMPDDLRDPDPVLAYRQYYRRDKAHMAKWRAPSQRPAFMLGV